MLEFVGQTNQQDFFITFLFHVNFEYINTFLIEHMIKINNIKVK